MAPRQIRRSWKGVVHAFESPIRFLNVKQASEGVKPGLNPGMVVFHPFILLKK